MITSNPNAISPATLRKARRHTQMLETRKGLKHLRHGLQRFARHRPVITSLVVLGSALIVWQAFGGRS